MEDRLISIYHTGFDIIKDPDLMRGRKNADFGPGFYTSPDRQFSFRWAKRRPGQSTYVNEYILNLDGLNVKKLKKDEEWFSFISKNRKGHLCEEDEVDVIIGPIANDTIYASFGIITSGFLSAETSLQILQHGNEYTQLVIKSEKAKKNLKWIKAIELEESQILSYEDSVKEETDEFLRVIAELI